MSWTLVGQDAAVEVLKRAVERDRVAHAYLFAGPKHVGKTRRGAAVRAAPQLHAAQSRRAAAAAPANASPAASTRMSR